MIPDEPASDLHVVTGGAGFIGSHLVSALLERGLPVRVVDDFSTGKRENLPDSVEVLSGDVCDLARRAVEGAAVVYHLAAQVSVPRSIEKPMATHWATEASTVAVLDQAERAGVRRVVLASSSAVYGDAPDLEKREDQAPAPASPYAAAKWCSEIHARHWALHRNLETVSLRFFNVYGPRQDPASPYAAAIPIFVSKLLAGQPVPVFGDGLQTRDFTFVEDVVRGILAAADAPDASGRVVNIASGTGTTILELIGTLAELLGRESSIESRPPRAGDLRHSRADIAAARALLHFVPATSLRAGLRRTIDWFLQQRTPSRKRSLR
ncbi:MAG TPA: NAD-dependent epimerase/dehydratase family protein [Planctomycetota bacterium]|nr:NAD-dependent epimerase/dehydratase family protein [Planctomycetota bacterium]